jgi:small-conductance mechanosensitive channel
LETWTDFIASEFQSGDDVGVQAVRLLVIIGVIWFLRWLLVRFLVHRTQDSSTIYWITKVSSYVATALSLIFMGQALLGDFGSLLTFIGLITAGLAIALRDPVTNMFAWLFIIWRRPYELGHRVQIGDSIGDVVDIRLFQTSLLELREWIGSDQPTGRIVHLPNSRVFTEMQYNYSIGIPFIWDEVPVLITFESDWEKAKKILTVILRESVPKSNRVSAEDLRRVSRTFRFSVIETDPVVITSVLDSGVLLTLRYTVRPMERRMLVQQIWEAILRSFAEHPDIDFAYPTTRFYDNKTEGPMAGMQQSRPRERATKSGG